MTAVVESVQASPVQYLEPAVSPGPFNVVTIEELAMHQVSQGFSVVIYPRLNG
jgi:hypothetical protein